MLRCAYTGCLMNNAMISIKSQGCGIRKFQSIVRSNDLDCGLKLCLSESNERFKNWKSIGFSCQKLSPSGS